jgi:signal transduction histidine kinase
VRVETRADGADGMLVDVVDGGAGVPADVAVRIFEPFFTTKARGKGTGLGLEIVQRIVSRHHGTIELLQERAGETRFRVRLPYRHPGA